MMARTSHILSAIAVTLLLAGPLAAQEANQAAGWVCGVALEEGVAFAVGAQLSLYPAPAPGTESGATADSTIEPAARVASDEHGGFCFTDLQPRFYELRVSHEGWPLQATRTVEARAGQVNRLTPVELEREPGDPRVSFAESFDGMPQMQSRGILEQLLRKGDAASLQEASRRLLPKRSVMVDVNRLMPAMDPKPLLQELLRQLERGYLPPMKTARYVYVVGEISDPRTRDIVAPVLLRKLRDGRVLPSTPSDSFPGADGTLYVSDFALFALARLAGKDFNWRYGKSPIENQKAISAAQDWWRVETEKGQDKQRR
ncbi:MAG: carboxypeptidase-like regulatory domain-containing protein [Candidatus Acidiferrales bacterium]